MKKSSIKLNEKQSYHLLYLSFAVIFIGFLMVGRLAQIAIFKNIHGVDLSTYQYQDQEGSSISTAKRGTIFDRKGQPLAIDTTSYSMYAVLKGDWAEEGVVTDIDYTASVLTKYLDLSRETIWTLLNNSDVDQVELGAEAKRISDEKKAAIEAENLPGIYFKTQKSRHYVNDYFASHLLGYVETNDEGLGRGILGVEEAYNDYLIGIEDDQVFSKGNRDLYLTLDSRLQNKAEDILEEAYLRFEPHSMGAYIVDLKDGALLTAAQRPSFNLNTLEGIDQQWQNLLIETANEPGSTIKMLTMAKAKELGVFSSGETYLSGQIDVNGHQVRDYNYYGWGQISFEDGFARSSNVAMVELVNRMGHNVWTNHLRRFGFGQTTDSKLQNETTGQLDFNNLTSQIMSGFGQGFSATPIQLLQAFTAIGNQGRMLKVQYLDHFGNQPNSYHKHNLGQLIRPEDARYVLDLMVKSVEDPLGTAKSFGSHHTQVAAKTGTAQIANEEGTGYLTGDNNYYFSVVTFFPAQEPRYMMYLFIKQPQKNNEIYGNEMLAQIFHPLLDTVLINQ